MRLVPWLVVGVRFLERQHLLARRLLDQHRRVEAERLRHVLDLRQVGQIVQAEADQEFLGRGVQERPADHLLAADDLDQVPLEQRVSTPEVLTPRISLISAAVTGCR